MARNCLGARTQCHDAFKVRRLVLFIRYRAAVAVEIVLTRTPACSVPLSNDSMHTVRSEEAVFDPLAQAVLIDGIAEVQISVAVFFPQRASPSCQVDRQARTNRESRANCFHPARCRDGIRPR